MRKEEPFISVIMACYNRQNCVAQAIESILNQTYTNFEFIIVDDHSTDNTYKIIKRYAKQDKRIIVLRNKKNNGINYYRNFNKAIALSKGKYIARMDDDDISLPQRFEKQVKYMEENPDVVVLGSKIETFPNEGGNWCPATNGDLLQMLMPLCCPICHPSVLIRKDFLRKHKIRTLLIETIQTPDENIKKGLGFLSGLGNGEVLFVKGSDEFAYFGELMSRLSMEIGLSGVVIDGLTRDSYFTQNIDLGIFCKGYSPKDIKGRGRVLDTDCEIKVKALSINSGDYVFGDSDAIVIIPQSIMKDLATNVLSAVKEEVRIKELIKQGISVNEFLKSVKEF